ncbi:UNVERIFIED_ORG: Fe-S cluster assembly protein SufD [Rhizobium sp. SORGH_AS260]|uniref:Fe-S cluster assembly protein SufD n=1 Tax=Agrobacterium sp. SORGH_AS_0440 TaxID=3041757 RepID=UPI002787444C|nr:Fe-S cluster assembly protein SufD [Agrobacterium sp. SORGH_AS_0440]MDP9733498.1 Fe-S cluster assembly protein SufD [Rhizobium sp. SORGH_AS_0285]MDP9754674.1 Fe-S cluster assembly protein SufD [Rhizobium sp. SORGH_AS_0260]MDR6082674.1 Fe-S cluster assembly protein SufD [Agrobacterium sp. SORGH_AS_0440]
MNIQATNRLTPAETALVDAYTAKFSELPGDGAVVAARDVLFDDLKTGGLPTRRIEAWHYTDLKSLLRTVPEDRPAPVIEKAASIIAGSPVAYMLHGTADIGKVDGVSRFADSLLDGSAAAGLAEASKDDTIGRINGSFVRDGLVVEIPADAELDKPIELQAIHGAGQVHSRFPVRFGKGSKATVIERHLSVTPDAALVSSVSDIVIEDGAEATWILLQQQGAADIHLGQLRIKLGAEAKLRLFLINAGGKLVRQELRIDVEGEGTDLIVRGVNLLGGETHTDVTMVLGHNVPNTTSTEVFRNVVFDRAKGIFQGMIRVAPDAQKTDAKMACNTLLMSDDGEFSAKPELEIFADDVQCGHGATVADISDNHLYYLMARGVPRAKARAMLVNAFVAEIVEELEEENLVKALETIISGWLEHHA